MARRGIWGVLPCQILRNHSESKVGTAKLKKEPEARKRQARVIDRYTVQRLQRDETGDGEDQGQRDSVNTYIDGNYRDL